MYFPSSESIFAASASPHNLQLSDNASIVKDTPTIDHIQDSLAFARFVPTLQFLTHVRPDTSDDTAALLLLLQYAGHSPSVDGVIRSMLPTEKCKPGATNPPRRRRSTSAYFRAAAVITAKRTSGALRRGSFNYYDVPKKVTATQVAKVAAGVTVDVVVRSLTLGIVDPNFGSKILQQHDEDDPIVVQNYPHRMENGELMVAEAQSRGFQEAKQQFVAQQEKLLRRINKDRAALAPALPPMKRDELLQKQRSAMDEWNAWGETRQLQSTPHYAAHYTFPATLYRFISYQRDVLKVVNGRRRQEGLPSISQVHARSSSPLH